MKKVYLIAIVVALLCGFLVYMYLGNVESRVAEAEREHAAPVVEMTNVVVAACDIPPRTKITDKMVVIERMPAEYVDENAATDLSQVRGLQADGTIVEGQVIMTTAIGTLDQIMPNLSARIPYGMRAMTIPVSSSSGIGGYVTEGDNVDLLGYIAGDPDAGIDEILEVTIAGAKVIAVGDAGYSAEDGGQYNSLTLALTQKQTVQVFELMEKGDYYFTLYRMQVNGGE